MPERCVSPEPKSSSDHKRLFDVNAVVIILKDVIWEIGVEKLIFEIDTSTTKASISDYDVWGEGGWRDYRDSNVMREKP